MADKQDDQYDEAMRQALKRLTRRNPSVLKKADNAIQRAATATLAKAGRKGMRFSSRDNSSKDQVEDRREATGSVKVGDAVTVTRRA